MFQETQQHLCVRCAKSFTNESDLARHKNQPNSRCRYDHENVMHFRPHHLDVQPNSNPSAMAPAEPQLSEPEPLETEQFGLWASATLTENSDQGYMDVDRPQTNEGIHDESEPEPETPSPFFVEIYRNASAIFGNGDMFMDLFDKDPHSNKRKDNFYYPFASRQEWEVALYLLRSSLRMAELDKFLKLELVRPFLVFNISVV